MVPHYKVIEKKTTELAMLKDENEYSFEKKPTPVFPET